MCGKTLNPLGSATWGGLPLYRQRHDAGERLLDLTLQTPLLVLWEDGGTEVEVYRNARQHWHFRAHPHHFDLYAAGRFEAVTTSADTGEYLLVMFPPALTDALVGEDADAGLEHCRFQFPDRVLERLVRALASHATEGEPLGALYTQSLSAAVLERLGAIRPRYLPGSEAQLPAKTQALLVQLIEGRLASPPGVHDLARLASLRTSEFLKAFRLAFGSTPHQYVLERRIERAKSLLGQDRSLISIALELGFASHAHFSASFRSRAGCTPSEFRSALRREVESGQRRRTLRLDRAGLGTIPEPRAANSIDDRRRAT